MSCCPDLLGADVFVIAVVETVVADDVIVIDAASLLCSFEFTGREGARNAVNIDDDDDCFVR